MSFDNGKQAPATGQDVGPAIGIDLGTTNTVAAVVRDGRLYTITDNEGRWLQPSVVSFKPSGERVAGLPARLRRVVDPANTIASVKRVIGLPFRSAAVQNALGHFPFRVEEGENEQSVVTTRAGRYTVPQISSLVLTHMKELAERQLGMAITECVVTVPANFSDGQREATREAAELAGLRPLRILNEPTAAALAYGTGRQIHQRIAIFDLGGGTFDVTLLAVRDNLYEVLATGGDPFLGGDDIDHSLADKLARTFLEQHRVDLRAHVDLYARLLIASEQIKARLSTENEVNGTIKELAYGPGGVPLELDFAVTREELEWLITPLIERAIVKCEEVLAEAGVATEHVDEVILVGGSTRIPLVRQRVTEHFGRQPRSDLNPMAVVATGAALQAAVLSSTDAVESAPLLMDVTPHALGVAIAGGYTDVLVDKNSTIPTERTRVFTTAHDKQTEVVIRVCQGDQKRFTDNAQLGEVKLNDLRPAPRGSLRIEVSFLIDADGILQVSARDLETNRAEHATLRVLGVSTQ
ncbi:MAG: Hsp70 family protein [Pseudomonadota bacterium]